MAGPAAHVKRSLALWMAGQVPREHLIEAHSAVGKARRVGIVRVRLIRGCELRRLSGMDIDGVPMLSPNRLHFRYSFDDDLTGLAPSLQRFRNAAIPVLPLVPFWA